jgi:DsbC/DsbD-like thiol-disulfide interchange protein
VIAAHVLCLLVGSLAAAQQPPAKPPAPEPGAAADAPVRVACELLCDRTRIAAGETFELGARYSIPPGWHIYWTNPGDDGFPTEAQLAAPEGFRIEGPFLPGPERIELPGKVVDFGWQADALIVFRVTAPADLAAGSKSTFTLKSRWLMCRDACYFGEADKRLVLSAVDPLHAAEPANQKVFEKGRRRLPRPWKELTGASATWSQDKQSGELLLLVRVPGADRLDFIPAQDSDLQLGGLALGLEGTTATLALRLRARKDTVVLLPELRGVLRVQRGVEPSWYDVRMSRQPGVEPAKPASKGG